MTDRARYRTIGVSAVLAVALAGCGGDDATSEAADPPEGAPTTTATPTPTTLDQELVRLLAWCQGFSPGVVIDTGDDETDLQILTAIGADLNRNVPDEIAATWAVYTDETQGDELTTEWRAAARDLDRFWVDECSPYVSLGTKITQP